MAPDCTICPDKNSDSTVNRLFVVIFWLVLIYRFYIFMMSSGEGEIFFPTLVAVEDMNYCRRLVKIAQILIAFKELL